MTVPLNTSTVIDGRIMRLSPTAIDQFDDSTAFGCPTAWYFNRVLKVKSIETPAMLWGTAMHSRIEHYLRTGEDVLAKEERHGKSYIDAAKPYIIAIESPVLVSINGVQVDGKRDALAKWPGDKYEVIDWKSTSNIDEYAKTEDDMRNDTQVAVYAMDASLAFELSEVGVANVFFQKGSRRGSDKRSAVLGLKDLSRNFERIAGLIEQMKSVAAEKDIKKVPANREACSRGTGCQHFAACPNRMRMQSETKQVATFLDAMKKKDSKLIIKDVPADAPVGVPGLSGAALDAQMARETAAAKKAALMKQLAEMEAAELAPPKVEEKPFSILPPDAPKWAPPAEAKAEEKFEPVPPPKKAAPTVPAKVAVVEELAKQVKDLTVEYDEEEVKAAVEKVGRGGKRPGAGRKTKAEELLEVAGVTVGKTTIRANRIELTLGFNQAIRDASNRSTYSTGIASVTIGADFSGDAKEAHAMLLELAREAVTAQLSAILPEHQSPMEAVAAGK